MQSHKHQQERNGVMKDARNDIVDTTGKKSFLSKIKIYILATSNNTTIILIDYPALCIFNTTHIN